jgi:hypothetical protein
MVIISGLCFDKRAKVKYSDDPKKACRKSTSLGLFTINNTPVLPATGIPR